MARRRRHEEHDNHEAWAIPYGDLVTLLLAFFVVMYSMSSVNEGKYRVLSDSLNEAFHGPPRSAEPISVGEQSAAPIEPLLPLAEVNRMIAAGLPAQRYLYPGRTGVALLVPALIGHGATSPTMAGNPAPVGTLPERTPPDAAPGTPATPAPGSIPGANELAEQQELDHVQSDVSTALKSLISAGQVRVRRYSSWVAVDISTDILFGSGEAHLAHPAVLALERLARVLKPLPNAVRVEGHTDDRPINTPAFPSNWELSAARAASVVHLFMDAGIAPDRLAVLGFGQYRPVMSNATVAGRNANRRVEVVILGRQTAPEAGL